MSGTAVAMVMVRVVGIVKIMVPVMVMVMAVKVVIPPIIRGFLLSMQNKLRCSRFFW